MSGRGLPYATRARGISQLFVGTYRLSWASGCFPMDKDYLTLKRASASRSSSEWSDDDFDVLADGAVVGRIMKVHAAPVGSPWMWTLAFGHLSFPKIISGVVQPGQDRAASCGIPLKFGERLVEQV